MELILSLQISSDAMSSSGHALYKLICCYPVRIFHVKVQNMFANDNIYNLNTLLSTNFMIMCIIIVHTIYVF